MSDALFEGKISIYPDKVEVIPYNKNNPEFVTKEIFAVAQHNPSSGLPFLDLIPGAWACRKHKDSHGGSPDYSAFARCVANL